MKKNIFKALLLAGTIALGIGFGIASQETVRAESYTGDPNWSVIFTKDKKMQSNFKTSDILDIARGMQPGDDATITLKITNANASTTNWYMENEVIKSFEDAEVKAKNTNGGSYTYKLTYTDPNGKEKVLYDSENVGGDTIDKAGQGLNEATDSLANWFLLDELKTGKSGQVVLKVALEGETQGNAYQDTLADLQMNFAVELPETTTTTGTPTPTPSNPTRNQNRVVTTNRTSVKTGDTNMPVLYLVLMGVAGIILLILAIRSVQLRKKEAVSANGMEGQDKAKRKGGR